MDSREFEYGEMVKFMSAMQNAITAYQNHEYENALHNGLNAIDNALCVYLALVNDYPYTERQYEFARDLRKLVDREQMRVQMEFDNTLNKE